MGGFGTFGVCALQQIEDLGFGAMRRMFVGKWNN